MRVAAVLRAFTLVTTLGLIAPSAWATFHLMQIEQVIGGVGGDTTAQAIQLRMRTSFQNLVGGAKIWAWDANGQNPVLIVDPTTSVPNGSAGARVLIVSPNFADFTDPNAVPDFVMTNLIPQSYLAAGMLTFEDNTGTFVYWRLSWGGANYTGPTTGSTTNDLDGDFGPPFDGPLPSTSDQALLFQGSASAVSTSNANDYALTAGAATFTNNAGAGFTVSVPTPPCPGDLDNDLDVDLDDLTLLLQNFQGAGVPSPGGDVDQDGDTDLDDLTLLLQNFGALCD
jgi:hypothetical protein